MENCVGCSVISIQLMPPMRSLTYWNGRCVSHSSNYTSGLDVGINGPLKKQSKTDITLWEAYLRKQSRSLRIEDFPHVVAGAISKAVKESSIVDCYKQSSTWPIDPDIVLNKMTISASNQRLTFAEYTTKHSVPAPVPEAQSDLPLENVIATSPDSYTASSVKFRAPFK